MESNRCFTPGLCSVTLRALDRAGVVGVAAEAGLQAIEWGGDVHVPHGDLDAASDAADRCVDAGISTLSYGSYLFAGRVGADDIAPALDTCVALGAPNVRVWCDFVGRDPDPVLRYRIVRDLATIAALADQRDLAVSLEFHPHTPTETAAGTRQVLVDVGAPNLFTYWQAHPGASPAILEAELAEVANHLTHLHVFWWDEHSGRYPLADGEEFWRRVPDLVGTAAPTAIDGEAFGHQRAAFLEFVVDDDPANVVVDARALREWLVGGAGGA